MGDAMSEVRRATRRRWLLVAGVAAVLAALPAAVRALPATTGAVPVARLLAAVRASAARPYQGYAISTGTAGLPALPQLSDVTDLLDGTSRLRVWYAAADHWRVDLLGTGTERDTYQLPGRTFGTGPGQDTFQIPGEQVTWDYARDQVTGLLGVPPVRLPRGADLLPPDLARRLLAAAEPGALSPLPARRIAGITAAGMRYRPSDSRATLRQIDVWADPASGLPLQVDVTGRGTDAPVLVTRFLELSLRAPDDAVLSPPPAPTGGTADASDLVEGLTGGRATELPDHLAGLARTDAVTPGLGIATYGVGLAQFVVVSVPRRTLTDVMNRARRSGGTRLDFPAGDGVLLSTPLVSVLAMDSHPARRNYLLAGLVDPALLRQAGAELSTYRPGA